MLIPFLLAGCQGDTSDGIDHDAVHKMQEPLKDAAVRSGGNWDKLSPQEQKLFLDRARGNESAAKSMLGMFASGPSNGPPKRS